MKKFVLGLAALAALSGAALASERTDVDPRDRAQVFSVQTSVSEEAPLLVTTKSTNERAGLSAYERSRIQAEINENGGN